ncbi:MAG: hypothetical protein HYU52_01700 [Acidobacteria bacterium]|nr:hypothetical protein [Acidobacteriota bacterium]
MNRTHVSSGVVMLVSVALALLYSPAAFAAENVPGRGAELQQALYDALVVIEKAGKLDSTASDGLYWNNPDVAQALEAMPNKEQFLAATRGIVRLSQVARSGGQAATEESPISASGESGSSAYPPNYPDTSTDVDWLVLHPLGLVSNNHTRCAGSGFAYYQAALVGANISLTAAQLACDASGCDPTGIVCISVCGATKIVQAAYLVAKVPVDACESWDAKIGAAENEASFRNSGTMLSDLSAHDDRIRALLATQSSASAELSATLQAHDAAVKSLIAGFSARLNLHDASLDKHDHDIKMLLDQLMTSVVANQLVIIKLLKTPEGRRPGWGKEGY